MLSSACYSTVDGSLSSVAKSSFHSARSLCFLVIIVLLLRASSCSEWFRLNLHTTLILWLKPLSATIYFWVFCQRSWLYALYLVFADLVFLQSNLFLVRFLLLISTSISMLFFASTVTVGIWASLLFREACKSSLTIDLDCVGCELPDLYFVFSHSPPHS